MGVYVHIPFCARKCYYCDFYSIVIGNDEQLKQVTERYLAAVCEEAMIYKSQMNGEKLTTLFFGGGTPSLIPSEQLAQLINFLLEELPFVAQPEITVEVNPHSLTEEWADNVLQAGVNRISLGAQAFQDQLLGSIGRKHVSEDIFQSIEILRDHGLNNVSLDLMYGLPGQKMVHWVETLTKAISLNPTHLSCYSLIIEEGTPFALWYDKGLLDLPSHDLQADMYEKARVILQDGGFKHYEISNFAKTGYTSQHNLLYWRNLPFLGLGTGATGYWQRTRYTNIAHVEKYLDSLDSGLLPIAHRTQVSLEQEMDETMMVGMRLLNGVSEKEFEKRYGQSFFAIYGPEIEKLLARGLVQYKQGFLQVTEQGLLLENMVSAAFLK